jgi:hypothetical protein
MSSSTGPGHQQVTSATSLGQQQRQMSAMCFCISRCVSRRPSSRSKVCRLTTLGTSSMSRSTSFWMKTLVYGTATTWASRCNMFWNRCRLWIGRLCTRTTRGGICLRIWSSKGAEGVCRTAEERTIISLPRGTVDWTCGREIAMIAIRAISLPADRHRSTDSADPARMQVQ